MSPKTPRPSTRPPARGRNGSPHPHHRKFASYHRSARLIKPSPTAFASLASESSPYYASKSRRNLITKEVEVRPCSPGTTYPDTPSRLISRQQNRTPPHQIIPNMSPPSPPLTPSPPAYAASSPHEPTCDDGEADPSFDTEFLEDPGWRNALFLNGEERSEPAETEKIGMSRGASSPLSTQQPYSLRHDRSTSTATGRYYRDGPSRTQSRLDCPSTDTSPGLRKRSSCNPVHFQDLGIGHSAHRLRERMVQKKWLSRRVRESLKSKDFTQSTSSGRICVPKRVQVGRDINLRSNLLGDDKDLETRRKHTTVDTIDVKSPESSITDPVLVDLLYNPMKVNRFSDDWAAHWTDFQYSADPVKNYTTGKSSNLAPFEQDSHRHPIVVGNLSIKHNENISPEATGMRSRHDDSFDDALPPPIGRHRQPKPQVPLEDPPTGIRSTRPRKEKRQMGWPNPGPRISSRAKVDRPVVHVSRNLSGKVLPPVPDTTSQQAAIRQTQANISRRKRAEPTPTRRLHHARSTDTLTKIEAEVPYNVPSSTMVNALPSRGSKVPPQVGPSGSPPERALPKLPEGAESPSKSIRGSVHVHSRRQSRYQSRNSSYTRDRSSVSSLSTVRAISPATTHRSSATVPEGVAAVIQHIEGTPKPDLRVKTNFLSSKERGVSLQSPISFHNSKELVFPNTAPAHIVQQVKRVARAERVKALKKRDLAPRVRIDEEDEGGGESRATSPPTEILDPLDQFPTVPCSRPESRTSKDGVGVGVKRQSLSARQCPAKEPTTQVLAQSSIIVWTEAQPQAAEESSSTASAHTQSDSRGAAALSPPRRDMPLSVVNRPLRPVCPVKAPSGEHTPPPSSASASEGEEEKASLIATTNEGRRLEELLRKLRSEVQHFVSLQDEKRMLQDRKIEKMHRLVGLLKPAGGDGSRSRGRAGCEEQDRSLVSVNASSSATKLREEMNTARPLSVVSSPSFNGVGVRMSGPGPALEEEGEEGPDSETFSTFLPVELKLELKPTYESDDGERLSAVVSTAKVDSMLESMDRSSEFGFAGTMHKSPVKIRSLKRMGWQGDGKKGSDVRMLWLQNDEGGDF